MPYIHSFVLKNTFPRESRGDFDFNVINLRIGRTIPSLRKLSTQVQHLIGREKTKALTRSVVDELENSLQLAIRNLIEVNAFREEETNEIVDVLIAAPLPRSMRISEINLDACLLFKFLEA